MDRLGRCEAWSAVDGGRSCLACRLLFPYLDRYGRAATASMMPLATGRGSLFHGNPFFAPCLDIWMTIHVRGPPTGPGQCLAPRCRRSSRTLPRRAAIYYRGLMGRLRCGHAFHAASRRPRRKSLSLVATRERLVAREGLIWPLNGFNNI
jgi:hypothetical protein